jgi:hypothetical protein
MMRVTARGRRALCATVLVIGSSVAVFSSSASPAAGDGPVQQVDEVGLLRLHLAGNGGTITFTPEGATSPTTTQTITATGKCVASTAGPLATLTSAGGSQGMGLVTNGLGVRQKNTCSTAEGRIGGAERLTLALGPSFAADVFIADAELDIEGKFNASLRASLDGAPVVSRPLVSASDNGPDAGVSDNDRVLLSATQAGVEPFRTMMLSASPGELSLEGGGDGSYAQYQSSGRVGPIGTALGTADSVFRLIRMHDFADDLFCQETRNAAVIGGSATSAEVTRLANDGGQECEDVGVTLEILDAGVLLDKGTTGLNTGTPQAVNAMVEIEWTAQPAEVPLPAREINFFDPDNPNDWETVHWCDSWDPVTQTAVHPADARFPSGVLPWCLVDEHAELQGDGTVVETQLYHGFGDPRWH